MSRIHAIAALLGGALGAFLCCQVSVGSGPLTPRRVSSGAAAGAEAPSAQSPSARPSFARRGPETTPAHRGGHVHPPRRAAERSKTPVDYERGDVCPVVKGRPNAYAIGSSTLGSVLGPMLQRRVQERWRMGCRRWGVASTGLARPDFFDWPAEIPSLNHRYDPDFYIVSLGTNDAQPLRTRRGGWLRVDNPEWRRRYGQRVDRMLELLAGPERRRMIIWLGPLAFPAKNSRLLGPVISEILAERIAAFDGHAVFVDAYTSTLDGRGKPRATFRHPETGETVDARSDDGIHLSTTAARWLLAEPVLEHLARCLDEPAPAPRRDRAAESRVGSRRRDVEEGTRPGAAGPPPAG